MLIIFVSFAELIARIAKIFWDALIAINIIITMFAFPVTSKLAFHVTVQTIVLLALQAFTKNKINV